MTRYLDIIFIELDTFNKSIFNRLYLYSVDSYLVYYDTLENYQDRVEPSVKRKLIYYSLYLLLFSAIIRMFLLNFFNDDDFNVNIGDVLFAITTNYRKWYILIINLLAEIILVKLGIFYYEEKVTTNLSKVVFTNDSHNILKYKSGEKSLLRISNITYYYLKYTDTVVYYPASLMITICALIAYLFTEYEYNIIILMVSTIYTIIILKIIIGTIFSLGIFCFTSLMFLKLKQDDIIKSIRFNVIWRNKIRLYHSFNDYHDFTIMVKIFSKFMNFLTGVCYFINPYVLSQVIRTLNEEPKNYLDNFLQKLGMFCIIAYIFVLYILDDIASTLTKVNKTLPKYLYPIFKGKNFNRFNYSIGMNLNYRSGQLSDIMVRMKIDSFIARLNQEFIGFYCFNSFKLTKLGFYKYLYMCMSTFVLIQDFHYNN